LNGKTPPGKISENPALYAALLSAVVVGILNFRYPIVGCDYKYFIPRLLDSFLYYRINGLGIEWWTPAFGGGLPSWPNPQQMQFSVPQALLFIVNPWIAVNATILIFLVAGFYGVFTLLGSILEYPRGVSILGATLFSANAFYVNHMAIGHLGFHAFPLLPWAVVLFLSRSIPTSLASLGLGAIITYLVYSGGFYIGIIFGFSVPLTLAIIFLVSRKTRPDYRSLYSRLFLGTFIGLLAGMSKIVAASSFLRHFPKELNDHYNAGVLQSLAGTIGQLFYAPIALFLQDGFSVTTVLRNLVGAGYYSFWELDLGLSPLLPIILLASVFLGKPAVFGIKAFFNRKRSGLFVSALALAWISWEISSARGVIYPLLKQLAPFQSFHVNVRFVSVFILPVVVFSVFMYRFLARRIACRREKRKELGFVFSIFTLLLFAVYANHPVYLICKSYNLMPNIEDWRTIKTSPGKISFKGVDMVPDFWVYQAGRSSLRPYEPIFGYFLERFPKKTHAGPFGDARNGYFNVTNPAGLVFPKENGIKPFDLISQDDEQNYRKFISYRPTDWKLSPMQKQANRVSLLSLIIAAVLGVYFTARFYRKR